MRKINHIELRCNAPGAYKIFMQTKEIFEFQLRRMKKETH